MLPKVGEKYRAEGPLINRNRGISVGSERILACNEKESISLSVFGNNNNGFSKVTIAKAFFAQNFTKVNEIAPPGRDKTYKVDKHFYPEVNAKDLALYPN